MRILLHSMVLLTALLLLAGDAAAREKGKKAKEDPYAEYVWPPPPDEARIRLAEVISGRPDVEAESRFKKLLAGASPHGPYDWLKKPFAVAYDLEGRVLVTDTGLAALIRFDRDGRRMDVFGTTGAVRLKSPLGLGVGPDGRIYVADIGIHSVLAFDGEGKLRTIYGRAGELVNPTDAAPSPDGSRLFVTDSKAHQIVVFDIATGKRLSAFGRHGGGEGELNFPTSLTFGRDGELLVVDQLNARVQVLTEEGGFIDQFGGLGVGFGNFVRPKDVAVDAMGLIYVTDNAFNNLQLFDADFRLLTFVGEGGIGPGRFSGVSGVAVRGEEIAVVDQLGHRLQVFRFLAPRAGDGAPTGAAPARPAPDRRR